jgi:hypothetical protein
MGPLLDAMIKFLSLRNLFMLSSEVGILISSYCTFIKKIVFINICTTEFIFILMFKLKKADLQVKNKLKLAKSYS